MKHIFSLLLMLAMCVYAAANANVVGKKDNATIQGQITDAADGAPLTGVTVFFPQLNMGTTTDINGNYTIKNLPCRTENIQVSYLGHNTIIEKIKLNGDITKDFIMHESTALVNEVVVNGLTGQSLMKDSPSPMAVVTPEMLSKTPSTNIIDAISHVPGLSQITTGAGISKPVIRGLGYNRVVVVNDGIRQEGQQWGDEHGIEIDPQSIHSAEILKGPASLRYGSDAMAGVVVFHHDHIPAQGTMKASAGTEYQSNNGMFDYTVVFAGNKHGFVWDWRYSDKMAHAYKNKYDGYVLGSQLREHAITGMLGGNGSWGFSHLHLGYYHLTPGIVEGERDELTGQFTTEDGIATHDQLRTYGKLLPFQQIKHYKAVSENMFYIGEGQLHAVVGYQQNRRQEFEESASVPGLDLQLHTLNYDVNYNLPELNEWNMVIGVNGMYQHSINNGEEFLIPDYNLFDFGIFATASRKIGKWNISGGARFDTRHINGNALEDIFTDFSKNFNGFTGSIGAVYNATENLNFRLNLSRGFRAPNISELASNGRHEGALRYELGNTDLKAENSWQLDAGMDYSSRYVSLQLSLFANRINNFIFAHKKGDEIREEVPVYQYVGGDATLIGGEATIDVHPVERLHFENAFSYVNARQLHQDKESKYLPLTPMPRWTSDLRYDIIRDGSGILNNTYASIGLECNLRQNHYLMLDDTESATPSYTLLNASIGTDLMCHGKKIASLYLTANNITDRAYQNHLGRLKYGDINNATHRQGVFSMGRNFGIKLLVPIAL
jgi:iron complex outermembrane receptor protein